MSASSPPPNENDQELLSAYLDGELTGHERAALEQRLAIENDLRAELASLHQTVDLVRSLPTLRAPRDFTLDPAVYRRPAALWRRVFTSPLTLQSIGALGAAASVILIVLGLLSTNPMQENDAASVALQPTQTLIQPAMSIDTAETIEQGYASVITQASAAEGSLETNQPMTAPPGEAQVSEPVDAHADESMFDDQSTSNEITPLAELALDAAPAAAPAASEEMAGMAAAAAQLPPTVWAQPNTFGQLQAAPPASTLLPGADGGNSALAGTGASGDTDQIGHETAAVAPAITQDLMPSAEKETTSSQPMTPTRAAVERIDATRTAAPSPTLIATPVVQPQPQAVQADEQDRGWLALVGVLTLAASLGVLYASRKRNRS